MKVRKNKLCITAATSYAAHFGILNSRWTSVHLTSRTAAQLVAAIRYQQQRRTNLREKISVDEKHSTGQKNETNNIHITFDFITVRTTSRLQS